MSSKLAVFLTLVSGPAFGSNGASAEQALDRYQKLTGVAAKRCVAVSDNAEILVCATDPDRYRLPLPELRTPQTGARQLSGDVVAASAERVRTGSCGVVKDGVSCFRGTKIISSLTGVSEAPLAVKALAKLIAPDLDVDPPLDIPGRLKGRR